MKKTIKLVFLILLFELSFLADKAETAISISATGSWSETIDSTDLQAGAGSNLISTYESDVDAVSIYISATAGVGDNWRVDVKKVDTTWHANFLLYVQRTSAGTGSGTISGGVTYQVVTDTDQSFFNGDADRSDVTVQLKLEGVSVAVVPNNYSTTVYYTVVDTA